MNRSIIGSVLMPKNGCPSKMFYRKSDLKGNKVKKGKDRPFLGEVFQFPFNIP